MRSLRSTVAAAALTMTTATGALAAPVLEPTTQKFIDGLAGGKPIYTLSPQSAREVLLRGQSGPIELAAVSIEDRLLPVGPTGQTRIRVIRPEHLTDTLPVILYFHGAGWVMGDTKTHDRLVRELATGAMATVVFVDYERSPENRYPVAIEQDYAVTDYGAKPPKEFNVDASRLPIAGDRVGGNLAAVVSPPAKQRHGPVLHAPILFYPVTDLVMTDRSPKTFPDAPCLPHPTTTPSCVSSFP